MAVVTPIIHTNGDRREVLIARLEDAYKAVRAAMNALKECAPNDRNFYPNPGRLDQAEAQHRTRRGHLMAVYISLNAEVDQIELEAATNDASRRPQKGAHDEPEE